MTNNTPSRRSLPNEIVLIILHHVTQLTWPHHKCTLHCCSLVNKQFNALANSLMWAKPVIINQVCYQRFLTCLAHAHAYSQQHHHPSPGQLVHQLHLSFDTLTDFQLERVWPHVANVQYVKLPYRPRFTVASIQQLARHCHHLTSLEVHHVTLSPATFLKLGRHCHRLRRLYLQDCHMTSPNILRPLSDNDTPLEELTLSTCAMDQDTQVTDLTRLQHLTYLELIQVPRATMKSLLVKAAIPTITTTTTTETTTTPSPTYPWPRLKKCTFEHCMDIDDDTWLAFIKTHPQLEDITIVNCIAVTDKNIISMATWLPHLIHVRFIGLTLITPDGIRQLIKRAPTSLQSVLCNDCPAIRINHFPELPPWCQPALESIIELDSTAIETIRREFVNNA